MLQYYIITRPYAALYIAGDPRHFEMYHVNASTVNSYFTSNKSTTISLMQELTRIVNSFGNYEFVGFSKKWNWSVVQRHGILPSKT